MKNNKKGFGRITQWICEHADRILSLDIIFLVGCIILSTIFGGRPYERFDDIILWSTAALSGIAMGLTGLLIYKQFNEQKKANDRLYKTTLPIIISEVDRYCYLVQRGKKDEYITHLSVKHSFKNISNNTGYIRPTVYAFVSNHSKPISKYKMFKIRGRRSHYAITLNDDIEVYSHYDLSINYIIPLDFVNCHNIKYNNKTDDHKWIIRNLSLLSGIDITNKEKEPIITLDMYNNIKDPFTYDSERHLYPFYLIFICFVRSQSTDIKWDYLVKDKYNISYDKSKKTFITQKCLIIPNKIDDALPSIINGKLNKQEKTEEIII